MYFHPLILTEAQKQQKLAAYRELVGLWLDGVERQYRLHTDAVSEFFVRQKETLWSLSEAADITHFVLRCFVRAAPASLELMIVPVRSSEIAADVHRQVAMLADRHVRELNANLVQQPKDSGTSAGEGASDHGKPRRRQMTA